MKRKRHDWRATPVPGPAMADIISRITAWDEDKATDEVRKRLTRYDLSQPEGDVMSIVAMTSGPDRSFNWGT